MCVEMADPKTKELLESWGFEKYVGVFEEQEIGEEALSELTNDILKDFVPKSGPRVLLLKKINEHKAHSRLEKDLNGGSDAMSNYSTISNYSVLSVSTNTGSTNSVETDTVEANNEDVAIKSRSDLHDAATSSTAEKRKSMYTRQLPFYGEKQFKQSCRPVYHFNLQECLGESTTGNYVLGVYEADKILHKKARTCLVQLIINEMFLRSRSQLINEDFDIISDKIIQIFPTENKGTYYIPPTTIKEGNNVRHINAKGKLPDKYRNVKSKYKADTIQKQALLEVSSDIEVSDDILESVTWLKNNSEPWDEVLLHWGATTILRKRSNKKTVEEFIEEWPILKKSFGHILIERDFYNLFDSVSRTILFASFDIVFNKLLSLKMNIDKTGEELKSLLNLDLHADSKYAVKIILLSYLLPPCRRLKVNKGYWKPSIKESQESIILHVKIPADISTAMENRKEKLLKYGTSVQPYVLVVGANLQEITDFYAVVANVQYKQDSVIKAFDTCFKCFHALNAQYPLESEHIWLLVQKGIYKFTTIWDNQNYIPQVETVLTDLEILK